MAVVKKDSLTVVPASSITVVQKKKPQKILDEDTYTQVSLIPLIVQFLKRYWLSSAVYRYMLGDL